jgi:hypothetical protein
MSPNEFTLFLTTALVLLAAIAGVAVLAAFHVARVQLFWLAILFGGFSLMARPNATTLVALVICALSVSGAIFLILELDQPFTGTIPIHSEPFRNALPHSHRRPHARKRLLWVMSGHVGLREKSPLYR